MERVSSEDNIADPLTKSLSQIVFEHHKGMMGIKHIGDWLKVKWEIASHRCLTSQSRE